MAMATDWQSGKILSASIWFMFEKEIDTDITFRFPNTTETIKAHRLILKARSCVFFTMFHSELGLPGDDMEITDIEPDIFKEFLRYVLIKANKHCKKSCILFYRYPLLLSECMNDILSSFRLYYHRTLPGVFPATTIPCLLNSIVLYQIGLP